MRDKHDKSAVEVKACLYIAAAAFPRHKTPIFEGNELSFIILPFEGSFTFSFIQKAKFRILTSDIESCIQSIRLRNFNSKSKLMLLCSSPVLSSFFRKPSRKPKALKCTFHCIDDVSF